MFSSLASVGTAMSIDPDSERTPPPEPTVVCFPAYDTLHLESSDQWAEHLPDLFRTYGHISKPTELLPRHLQILNIQLKNEVSLEELVPSTSNDEHYLPPPSLTQNVSSFSRRTSAAPSTDLAAFDPHAMLSNGKKAPDIKHYLDLARELSYDTEDGLRHVSRRRPRKGHMPPNIHHYHDFWAKLETLAQYWDTAHDKYFDTPVSRNTTPLSSPKAFRRLSAFMLGDHHAPETPHAMPHHLEKEPEMVRKYTGFRRSKGSRMPEQYRIDVVRAFVKNIVFAFQCQLVVPKKTPHFEIGKLLVPVTQAGVAWRIPEDKGSVKKGYVEGPLLGVQVRHETDFIRNDEAVSLDMAREIASVLLLAQERAREGRPREVPGEGKWYTTVPRWGGGIGGEFGEAEGDKDAHPQKRFSAGSYGVHLPKRMTEEEIWKELKPGSGLWDPHSTYLAVGKDRAKGFDSVFSVSSLYHHIAIIRLDVQPHYVDFVRTEKGPLFGGPDKTWYKPTLYRTRWYDLLDANDRVEAFRGLWGIMGYLMRGGSSPTTRPVNSRQKSDLGNLTTLRRKSAQLVAPLTSQRSHSVAF